MGQKMKCDIDFTVSYRNVSEYRCELDLFHDGPHECDGFVWGHRDQTRDPFTQERKRLAAEREAARLRRSRLWRKLRRA